MMEFLWCIPLLAYAGPTISEVHIIWFLLSLSTANLSCFLLTLVYLFLEINRFILMLCIVWYLIVVDSTKLISI